MKLLFQKDHHSNLNCLWSMMGILINIWRKYTHTEALNQMSGKLERDFFESVYRVTYFAGLSTTDKSTSYLFYKYFVRLLILLLACGEVWFVCTDGSNLDEGAKCLSVIMIQCITQYRYRNVISNKHLYTNMAKSMDSPHFDISTKKRRNIVEMWAQKSDTYLKLVIFLGNASLWSWFVDPLFDDIDYNLVTDTRLPFDYETPQTYPVGYFLVMISLWYVGQNVMVTDGTMQAHLIHILCQFDVLADCFENVLDDTIVGFEDFNTDELIYNKHFVEKFTKRLGNLVEQHELILSHTRNLETVLSRPMLAQMGASGLMICFLGYQAITAIGQGLVAFLGIVVFLSYNLFQIYIICSWCEEITGWSSKIGDAIYFSGWECVAKIRGVRSTLMIVIARANNPVYLTAGGMYYLSIESFGRNDLLKMGRVTELWKFISHTSLLDQTQGKLQKDFFESVYRVTYITGLSVCDRSIGYLLYSNIIKLMMALFVCGELSYVLTKASSLDLVSQPLGCVVLQSISIYRYQNLMSNKPFYDELAKSMNSPYFDISTESRRKLVENWARRSQKYLNVLLIIGNSTLLIWGIFPLFDDIEYNLITEFRLPFHYQTPILYAVAYLITLVTLLAAAYLVMVTALTMQAHLIHLLCQFDVLADCFENVLIDCSKEFVGPSERDLINNECFVEQFKIRLDSNTRTLKAILSRPMLGQLASSGILMCCLGYQAIMTITENFVTSLVALLFLVYNVFELYIICRWSEDIKTWSIKIGEAVYCSGWECGTSVIPGVRATIVLVIARANKPVIFTAGGMYDMSIASFVSLVKASYSALTVVLRFRHK